MGISISTSVPSTISVPLKLVSDSLITIFAFSLFFIALGPLTTTAGPFWISSFLLFALKVVPCRKWDDVCWFEHYAGQDALKHVE